jgi:hypothetical protein
LVAFAEVSSSFRVIADLSPFQAGSAEIGLNPDLVRTRCGQPALPIGDLGAGRSNTRSAGSRPGSSTSKRTRTA